MELRRAKWGDVVQALALEAELLGDGVAWSAERARKWWDAGRVIAFVVEDDEHLCGYASAMQLSGESYQAVIGGILDPEHLELGDEPAAFYWVGIVIVDPAYQGCGIGTWLLSSLLGERAGQYVADVYSPGGKALVECLGWIQVLGGEHPLYVAVSPD